MRRYRLTTKREAVNFALRSLAAEPFGLDEARRMRGSGWDGDLDDMRGRGDGVHVRFVGRYLMRRCFVVPRSLRSGR